MSDVGAINLGPADELKAKVASMHGWRDMGERMRQEAIATCPIGEAVGDDDGRLLIDAIEVHFEDGSDARIELGTWAPAGQEGYASYVVLGTEPHPIEGNPVLAFVTGGTTVFTTHVDHPGNAPNDFITQAMTSVAQER